MKIKIADLRRRVEAIIGSKYYSQQDAVKIADVLLYAELAGKNTQGVLKLFGTEPLQDRAPQYAAKIVKETKISTLIDGGYNAGMLVAQDATDKAIKMAFEQGFGIVGINNTSSGTGAIGFYARKIAQQSLIGFVATNSPKTVLHFGAMEPVYGTNPMAFGFPTLDNPIVFDMAASAITWYGLVRAQTLGEKIPDNVAIDKNGNMTNDPEEAMRGAILPFDRSYKGSGMAMVVELLAGVLTGSAFVSDKEEWGTTMFAFSPSLLLDTDEFKKRSSDLVRKVKATKSKPGEKIRIPGYDLEEQIQEQLKTGEVEIEDEIFNKLAALTS